MKILELFGMNKEVKLKEIVNRWKFSSFLDGTLSVELLRKNIAIYIYTLPFPVNDMVYFSYPRGK